MFDFGFSELVVICVIALVVLGPTRLPGVVRKVGRWIGKARAMARDFREQLESEVNLEELGRATRQQPATPPPRDEPQPADAPSPPEADPGSYPYGRPTDVGAAPADASSSSAASADPHVVMDGPQPGDDDYSHAHAPGAPPEPWSPQPEPEPDAAEPRGTSPDKPGP